MGKYPPPTKGPHQTLSKCFTLPRDYCLQDFISHEHPFSLKVSFESKAHGLLYGIRALNCSRRLFFSFFSISSILFFPFLFFLFFYLSMASSHAHHLLCSTHPLSLRLTLWHFGWIGSESDNNQGISYFVLEHSYLSMIQYI